MSKARVRRRRLIFVVATLSLFGLLCGPSAALAQGNTWRLLGPVNIGGPIADVSIDPADPNRLIVASPGGGLWRSADGGASWQAIDLPAFSAVFRSLARDPLRTHIVYAVNESALLRSVDRGATWNAVSTFPASPGIMQRVGVTADGQVVIVTVSNATGSPGSYQSVDDGVTWTAVHTEGGGGALAVSPVLPSRAISFPIRSGPFSPDGGCKLYRHDTGTSGADAWYCDTVAAFAASATDLFYAGSGGRVFRGSGHTATAVAGLPGPSTTFITAIWVDPTNSNIVVAGSRDLFRTVNGGDTWTQISNWEVAPSSPGSYHYVVRSDPGFNGTSNRRVYVGSAGGLFRTDDIYAATPTAGWTDLNGGLVIASLTSPALADGAVLAVTSNNEAVRVPDGSTVGTRPGVPVTFGVSKLLADVTNPSYVFRSAEGVQPTFYRSEDGGATFSPLSAPETGRLLLDPNDGNRLYLSSAAAFPKVPGALYRTTSARSAAPVWDFIESFDSSGLNGSWVFAPGSSSLAWTQDHVFLNGQTSSKLKRSSDLSSDPPTFVDITPPGTETNHLRHVFTIATPDGQVGYASALGFPSLPPPQSLWRTANGGDSWTRLPDFAPTITALTTHPDNPDWVFAATNDRLYQSSDGGITWMLNSPARVGISSLVWRDRTLIVATTGRGLFAIDLPGDPLISVQPANQFVINGRNASFNVGAAGAPAVSYQWQISTDGGTTWTNLANDAAYSGVTTATLNVTAATVAQSGTRFRNLVSNSLGLATSNAATLSVAAPAAGVATGGTHACAVNNGSGAMCWGANFSGQLGDGTLVPRSTPAAVSGLSSGVTSVAANAFTSCAIQAGALKCWGMSGGLTPVLVSGLSSGVTAAAVGLTHRCAVQNGEVWCWGSNTFGQIGDGTTTFQATPVKVVGLPAGIIDVALGDAHSCALTGSGSVMCWGRNLAGQLGDGTTTDRLTPVMVSGLSSGATAIATGTATCAVAVGAVVCWGGMIGSQTFQSTPVPVAGLASGIAKIAVGSNFACALTTGGAVKCWGNNESGQIGDGTTTQRPTPVQVLGLISGVTGISTSLAQACALSGGGVVCWGSNWIGQLGDGTLTNRTSPVPVHLGLIVSPTRLQFAATKSGATLGMSTPSQTVTISIRGAASTWTATSDQPWLQLTPGGGTGSGTFTATLVNPNDVIGSATTLAATITVLSTTLDLPLLATIPVTLTIEPVSSTAPFGSFDTPANGANVAGSIAVTGWALDNIAVTRVEIWRDLVAGETTPPYTGPGPGNGKVFIANASFVDGARPDVEGAFPTMPLASRAGWGYLLLTYGLWNRGNGTYTLYAFAYDAQGHASTIGTKVITSNNAGSTKPFGAIDTPANGQTVTTSLLNYGWALTPNATPPCTIPPNGVQVSIDSGPLQPVTYGGLRPDVAAGFPGLTNSSGAGGVYALDTSLLTNGTHQIGWLVTDNCGRADGIGSRFFNVLNISGLVAGDSSATMDFTENVVTAIDEPRAAAVRRGLDTEPLHSNPSGQLVVSIAQGERVEVELPSGAFAGYHVVNGERRALPLGSSLDAAHGIFYWQPAPAFLGPHDLEFVSSVGSVTRVRAIVGTSVQHVIDTPQPGAVTSSFVVAGWAIDEAAREGTGVDTLHVWAYPTTGAPPIFVGVAAYGDRRSDIGALFGDRFAGAAYGLPVAGLAPGGYDIVVYPHSSVTGDFQGARVVRVTVRE